MDNAPSRDHRLSNKKSVPDKGSLPSSCESRGYKRSSEHYRFAIAFVGLLELEGRTLSLITLPSLITGLRGIRGSWPEASYLKAGSQSVKKRFCKLLEKKAITILSSCKC